MKRVAIIVSLVVVLAVVVAGLLLVFPPKGPVQSWLVQQVKNATGQELKVNGDMSLRLLPRVVLRLENVELANPPGPPREPVFAARVVQAEADLWPLLFSRTIDQVGVEEARIALAVDQDGRWNLNTTSGGPGSGQRVGVRTLAINSGSLAYSDARSGASAEIDGLSANADDLAGTGVGSIALKGRNVTLRGAAGPAAMLTQVDANAKSLSLDKIAEVTIKAAALRYRKDGGGEPVQVERVQANAKSVSRAAPLEADVAFDWDKERLAGNVKLQSLGALIDGASSPASVRVAAPKGKLAFDAASAEGKVKVEGKRLMLEDAILVLDATKAAGTLTVDFSGARPLVSGKLAANELDAGNLFGIEALTRTASARARALEAAAPPETSAVPVKEALKVYMRAQLAALDTASPTDVVVPLESLTADQPRARSAADWPDEAIDLSGLKTVDLDLSVSVVKLMVASLDVGVPEIKAALKNGLLSLDARDLAIQGGRISGTATVDVTAAQPKLATKFKAEGIDALAVFDAVDQRRLIAGKSTVDVDLRGSGSSQRKLIGTLTGKLKATTSDGAIVGYDLSSVWKWIFGPRQYDPKRRTPFDRLEAEVALSNGVASKSTVQVKGPVLGATADGMLKLPSRELDYRARLSLASLGQTLGLRIFGAWQQLSFAPDWGGFTRSTDEVSSPLEALKDADLKDPELARLTDEVLKKAGSTGALPPQAIRALEELKARAEGRE